MYIKTDQAVIVFDAPFCLRFDIGYSLLQKLIKRLNRIMKCHHYITLKQYKDCINDYAETKVEYNEKIDNIIGFRREKDCSNKDFSCDIQWKLSDNGDIICTGLMRSPNNFYIISE